MQPKPSPTIETVHAILGSMNGMFQAVRRRFQFLHDAIDIDTDTVTDTATDSGTGTDIGTGACTSTDTDTGSKTSTDTDTVTDASASNFDSDLEFDHLLSNGDVISDALLFDMVLEQNSVVGATTANTYEAMLRINLENKKTILDKLEFARDEGLPVLYKFTGDDWCKKKSFVRKISDSNSTVTMAPSKSGKLIYEYELVSFEGISPGF